MYSLFSLVMCILFQRISDHMISWNTFAVNWAFDERNQLLENYYCVVSQKKVLSRAHVYSLEQNARNAHHQNEQTLLQSVPYENGALSFQQIPVGIRFNVLMYLSPHRRIYDRIG